MEKTLSRLLVAGLAGTAVREIDVHTPDLNGDRDMTNPFEEADGTYLVLINDENQHSLWPFGLAVPPGWRVALEASSRAECLDYVEANWRDMRPASLTRA
ncbi:MbtH family protein [Streptosporangium sp. NPDC001559]|uniref:MbtH family protein n=1 Tax=Streptosporangium sp. NPDC001559 TaxID=3366187 RepID=UPI0036E37270